MKNIFTEGQRWISEMEPELGLGMVIEFDKRTVKILFPASDVTRQYAISSAPIKRVKFKKGDQVTDRDGKSITVDSISDVDGLFIYHGGGNDLVETSISDTVSFSKPEERLLMGHTDQKYIFDLRYETHKRHHEFRKSETCGFIGGRIDLIPHQFYIAHETVSRKIQRVLLSDEVGLGKTIEACLILHRLITTGRVSRVLLLVPPSLVHQWFLELMRRFNLVFRIADDVHCKLLEKEDPQINPFMDDQMFICNIEFLAKDEKRARKAIDCQWDMLIVDEAHHLIKGSLKYNLVEAIGLQTPGLLLLTATPEHLDLKSHFSRLRLLDPARYHDFNAFQEESKYYLEIAGIVENILSNEKIDSINKNLKKISEFNPAFLDWLKKQLAKIKDNKSRKQLVQEILDRYGTGRVVFRNTRKAISGFPKRKAHLIPLTITKSHSKITAQLLREYNKDSNFIGTKPRYNFDDDPRIEWLAEFLHNSKGEKILMICTTREKVLAVNKSLEKKINFKLALFHEDLTMIQRDRNAFWFSEKEGANLLICSEIGSEGRNFQFASNIVLFDLPLDPELIEQRIGRLDRIGQKKTVNIHIPYILGSHLEVIGRWFHEALHSIEKNIPCGRNVLEKFGQKLRDLISNFNDDNNNSEKLKKIIDESSIYTKKLIKELEKGRDYLLELNSCKPGLSQKLINQIERIDNELSIDKFMLRIFHLFGVNTDEISPGTYRLFTGKKFKETFPAFKNGMTVTFKRDHAMVYEDITFLSWDHPMIIGAMELMAGLEHGNSSFVTWKGADLQSGLLLEAIFILESVAPLKLHIDRFLPPTPVRVIVNHELKDCTTDLPNSKIRKKLSDLSPSELTENKKITQKIFPKMLNKCEKLANDQISEVIKSSLAQMNKEMKNEIKRLTALKKVNPNVMQDEIDILKIEQKELSQKISSARLRLDALRLIGVNY